MKLSYRIPISILAFTGLCACNPVGVHYNDMMIAAIKPTGDSFYTPHPQAIWRFGITNIGNIPLWWSAGVDCKPRADKYYDLAGGHIEWPEGVLEPGKGLETNMIVPAGVRWRGVVNYDSGKIGTVVKTAFEEEWHR